MYSDYSIAFDGLNSWSFGNDFAKNTANFGVDNSSSSHADKRKNKFLELVLYRKSLVLILVKQRQKFCVKLHLMMIIVIS